MISFLSTALMLTSLKQLEKSFNLNLFLRLLIKGVVREVTLHYYLIYLSNIKIHTRSLQVCTEIVSQGSENCTNMGLAGEANESDVVGKWIWRPKHNLWSFFTFLQVDDRK